MSLFVAGTDTGVGKTLVCAAMLVRYRDERPLGYWKPVATGASDERDLATVAMLAPGISTAPESYLFRDPVSPHLASRREGVPIDIRRVVARFAEMRAAEPRRVWVVEGAGGLLVPLDEHGALLVDLVAALDLPVLLVARSTLGTINHTLLSLAALASRGLPVAGVVLSGPRDEDNRRAIERFGGVPVLGELDRLAEISPATLAGAAAMLDPGSLLAPWLGAEAAR